MNPTHPVPSGESPPEGAAGDPIAALLRRSARGDQAAFADLYDATAARLHGLVLRVVRDPAQADEVTQEAYLEIWRTAARFDSGRGSALAWLMTIGHRRAVDRVRSAQAATRRDNEYLRDEREAGPDVTAEAALSGLEARRVRTALEALTAVQREAIELAYFGGYTHTEVAALLDLPVGTAKTRIRDGLIRLRDTMGVGQ
ncbi:ECF RNA polymerase sigma factor SigK [Nocardioides daejeonensis]|uniref:ECF RNA polymerase sigma factor SigK n=1 Tax=Nocardioides daejeonensis TaxID=1046556 RepID=UPI000D74855A|nr:ECF RNA polymerase sigma factor SigK [Nocardioides daejeonensis]